jgi:hypothetical protein
MKSGRTKPRLTWRTTTTTWPLSIDKGPDQKQINQALKATADTPPIEEILKPDPDSTKEEAQRQKQRKQEQQILLLLQDTRTSPRGMLEKNQGEQTLL